jgi:RNA polymerase sigma factor (sigma-70 family)
MSVENSTNTDFYDLLNAIKVNSHKILQQLYAQNYPGVEKYIIHNNGSASEAKDIFQEAFVAVWRSVQLDKFVPNNEKEFSAYLFRVSRNKWISYLRSAAYKNIEALESDVEEIAAEEIAAEEQNQLLIVLDNFKKLGDNCKDLLTRFYYKKQSLRQIADQFEWTEATARNNKYRCIEKLRNLLKDKK